MADVLGDRKVVEVLDRAVWGINPVLDLAYSDPLGIKRRTFEPTDPERNAAAMVLDAAAWVLDVVKFPGTAAWSVMTDEQRSKWWTTRLGALNTVAVAFPGIFGVLLNRLPIQDLLAFANQAVVLVAVAREHGVTERDQQVDLLASVLCRRETKSRELLTGEDFAEKSAAARTRPGARSRSSERCGARPRLFVPSRTSCTSGRRGQNRTRFSARFRWSASWRITSVSGAHWYARPLWGRSGSRFGRGTSPQ